MVLQLVKKEYLLIKKYVWIMFGIAALIPPFFLWRMPEYAGKVSYILACIFSVFLLLQYVLQKECTYPKATALLCATPYKRKFMVIARYMFCLGIFIICTLIYAVETLFLPLEKIHLGIVVTTLLAVAAFVGMYLPLQYKFGFEKAKIIVLILLMSSPVGVTWLVKNKIGEILLRSLSDSSLVFFYGAIAGISCVIYMLSMFLSVRIYNRADVA